ncbi:MAG: tyrosine-type recombinase/integrase [Planctomycetes bacterium]|nr:tyrosine-type recombinase/integrase [Planctomycetota bacterium]
MSAVRELRQPLTERDPPELHAFVELQLARNLSPRTIDWRTRFLRKFVGWLEKPVRDATLPDLRRFLAERSREHAPATYFGHVSILKTLFTALCEEGWIQENPSLRLEVKAVWRPRDPLSMRLVQDMFALARRRVEQSRVRRGVARARAVRDLACLEVLFATGIRNSELRAIRVVDVELEQGSILVRRVKGGVHRRLPLTAGAVSALGTYLSEARPALVGSGADEEGELLFVRRGGAPLRSPDLVRIVSDLGARCGGHAYPHALRRTLATELVRAGVSLPAVQKVLGHSHLQTTSGYTKVDLEDMRAAVDALDEVRARRRGEGGRLEPPLCLQRWLFAPTPGRVLGVPA